MASVEPVEYAAILETVRQWPPDTRRGFINDVAKSLDVEKSTRSPRGFSADQVVGLLKTYSPAPTDEECDRILEEELIKKHLR